VDVVHLVLYNITITKTNKYYDFASCIIPFFAQNWESLRLGDVRFFFSKFRKVINSEKHVLYIALDH